MTATLPERESLLAGVLAEPGANAPRLIFADWLEEYGDNDDLARAELIRVQLYLTRYEDSARQEDPILPCGCRFNQGHKEGCFHLNVVQRQADLLSTGRVFDWLGRWTWGALPGCPAVWHRGGGECLLYHNSTEDSKWTIVFRGGFVEEVRAPLDALLSHGSAILGLHPVAKVLATNRRPSRPPSWPDPEPDPPPASTCWWRNDELPATVFDAIPGEKRSWATISLRISRLYASTEEAMNALSEAILSVLEARQLAARSDAKGDS